MQSEKRTIQSIDRAVAILNSLANAPKGLPLSQLAAHLDLPIQTAQSLVRTLQVHDFIVQSDKGAPYMLGAAVLNLANVWKNQNGHIQLATAEVEKLGKALNEYVVLTKLNENTLTTLHECFPQHSLLISPFKPEPDKLHVLATGKVMLASLTGQEQSEALAKLSLIEHGPKAITDLNTLTKHLELVKRQGYGYTKNENSKHISALAVPIRNQNGDVSAILAIAAPNVRFTEADKKKYLAHLIDTVKKIEEIWA